MTDFSQLTDSDLIESVNAWRRTRNITNNGVNDIAHRKYTKLVREGEEEIRNRAALDEDTSRLDKDNVVHYNNDTSEFAKHYVRGHKGDHTDGGPTAKHKKDSNTFHSTYSSKDTRNGFAGAGTTVYTHNKTGDKFKVDRSPSGKGFYGTDHLITKIHESVNEAIAGWKHAASDINKARKNISNQNKTVSLVSLKKDGTPSKLNDAVTFHKSEQKAIEVHNRITELNPNRNIKHHLYVNGKLVRTLGESTTVTKLHEITADMARRARLARLNYEKKVVLEPLKNDGTTYKRARLYVAHFYTEKEAIEAHDERTRRNPHKNIKHRLYIDNKYIRTLGESTTPNSTRESLAKKYLDKAEARKNK